jgi:glycine/D-amino acid oxidase-like deaminating enzyme
VTVVGGGAFGTSCAIELGRRGHRVTLVDPGPIPHPSASSTDTSKAVRPDYGSDGFYADLALECLERWRAWHTASGRELWHETGILLLASDRLEPGSFEAESFGTLQSRGLAVVPLDRTSLGARFPAWAEAPYAAGYFNPSAGWVDSRAAVAWLAEVAAGEGVAIREGRRCEHLLLDGDTVRGVVLEGGERIAAEVVVVAAGAWTPSLLPWIEPLTWAVGQPVACFRPADPRPYEGARFPVWCAEIARTGWYGFPVNARGLLKIGHHGPGRRWRPGEPLEPTESERARFLAFVARTFPSLAGAPIVHERVCLYCDTFDGDFLIDRDPGHDGLIVACGGSGHAFKFAPMLGPLIADIVEGRPNPWARRFAWRAPGPRRTEQARHLD